MEPLEDRRMLNVGDLLQTLNNPTPAASDVFGYSVAVSGSTVAMGAYGDHTGAADSGAVYVFDVSRTPTGVDLLGASDTGISSTDNLTNLDNSTAAKTLQFAVSNTIPGATVTIYAEGTAIGSATATDVTTTVTTNGSRDLADGSHSITARQTEPGNPESPDSPALSITVDTAAPAFPVAPDLQAASDLGTSSTDNITSDNTPTFTVNASPYFRFYRNAVKISGDYQTGSSYTPAVQPDGYYTYKVSAVDAAGNETTLSSGLSVTIDTLAPAVSITPVSPDPRTISVYSIDFAFSEPSYNVSMATLSLTRDGGSNLLGASGQTVTNPLGDNIHYRLGGLTSATTAPGHYLLTLVGGASGIIDRAGNPVAAGGTEDWITNGMTFIGTAGGDVFAFSTDGTYHYVSVILSGQPTQNWTFDAATPLTLTFIGLGGNDTIAIDGGPQDETVTVYPYSVVFSGPNLTYQVLAREIADIRVTAGAGTGQTATMYDVAGAGDTFASRPTYCEMSGTGYFDRVTGFGPVDAYASGDSGDSAKFFDSRGADTFTASPGLASMSGPGYATNVAHAFSKQYGYGSFVYGQPGQGDRANLYDGPGNDTWIGYGPLNYSEITGPGLYTRAQGFDQQYGYVTGGGTDNVARFYDTPGDDIFNAKGDYSYLAGVDTQTWWYATGFQRVYAQKTAGGYDRAYFSHTSGDYKAIYNVRSYQGYMADTAGTFFNLASDFNEYEGVASIPGNTDEAYFRTTGGGDTLTFQPVPGTDFAIADLLGTTPAPENKPVHLYAYGFRLNTILRDTTDTAVNQATLTGTTGNDTFTGTPTDSRFAMGNGSTVRLTYWPGGTPRGFDTIQVIGNDGDDTGTMTGASLGTNTFWGNLADAVLSDGTLDLSTGDLTTQRSPFRYYYKLSGFDTLADSVTVSGPDTATNQKHVIDPIDYTLAFSGTWLEV